MSRVPKSPVLGYWKLSTERAVPAGCNVKVTSDAEELESGSREPSAPLPYALCYVTILTSTEWAEAVDEMTIPYLIGTFITRVCVDMT